MGTRNTLAMNRQYVADYRARRMDRGEREVHVWLDAELIEKVEVFAASCLVSRSDAIAALVGSGLERAVKPRGQNNSEG